MSPAEDTNMNYILLNRSELPFDGSTYEFEGMRHGNTEISFIWVDMPPGDGVRLHQHPYKEIFIVQEGTSTFTVGLNTVEAQAGHIIIVPANTPHKFANSGATQLKQIDIHLSKTFITHWLEERTSL